MQTLDTVYTAVQGAIADETAYESLKNNTGASANYSGITTDGIDVNEIIAKEDHGTDADKKAAAEFANEIVSLLGTKSTDNLTLECKKANAADNTANKGKIFVKVDDKMQVTVFAKGADNKPIDGLIVGLKN